MAAEDAFRNAVFDVSKHARLDRAIHVGFSFLIAERSEEEKEEDEEEDIE